MEGWIKLHRKTQNSWIWDDKPYARGQAWVDLLMLCSHQKVRVSSGNELVEIQRGSFVTSESQLMNRWGWSKSKVRSFLDMLQQDNMIEKITDKKKTTISVVNYDVYQDSQTTEEPQKDREKTTEEPQKNHEKTTEKPQKDCEKTAKKPQKDLNKNEKNEKNKINNITTAVSAGARESVVIDMDLQRIVKCYQQNIGLITPMLYERFQDWLRDVSADVVIYAVEEAVKNNVRKYSYIEGILKNWHNQGVQTLEQLQGILTERSSKQSKRGDYGGGWGEDQEAAGQRGCSETQRLDRIAQEAGLYRNLQDIDVPY